ncbi:Endoribonuclease L-PSP/chorismate mutase-like protein [Haematococcus lacustris]
MQSLSRSARSAVRSGYHCAHGLRHSCRQNSVMAAAGKEVLSTANAPAALGPYSQGIKAGNMLYVSGQVGLVPGTKEFASPDVEGQTEQALKNIGAILEAGGASYSHVVKTTILLADMADFAKVNAVYAKYFTEQPPARATYAVKDLPIAARVEIEAIAYLP